MPPLRWISTFILVAGLIGQLLSFPIDAELLPSAEDSALTTTPSAEAIIEDLPSEGSFAPRVAKAVLLASSRWTFRLPAVFLSPANASGDHHSPTDRYVPFCDHRSDNRGPPLA